MQTTTTTTTTISATLCLIQNNDLYEQVRFFSLSKILKSDQNGFMPLRQLGISSTDIK
jgi:hypothetical protein